MYLPQTVAMDMHKNYGDNVWENFKGMFQTWLPPFSSAISKWEQDDFVKWAISEDFMNPLYKGEYSAINTLLTMKNADRIEKVKTKSEMVTLITDIRDALLPPLLVDGWMTHKTVYKPDRDFVNMLMETKDFKLHISQLNALPYQDLCFDFSACPDFYPIKFGYLSFRYVDGAVMIANYLLNDKTNLFSFYYGAKLENDYIDLGSLQLRNELSRDTEYLVSSEFSSTGKPIWYDYTYSRKQIAEVMLQLIGYLTCQNTEIKESQISKKRYKKHPVNYKPKDDISEFREFEVGVKIGKTIRKYQSETSNSETEHKSVGTSVSGNSKSPHIRGAHWHHYWTGKGRTELVVHWIPPTFINKDKPAKNITVHKIE